MRNLNTLLVSAVSGALALGLMSGVSQAAEKIEMEKCYSIVKAGKNDCQTSSSACASTSTASPTTPGRPNTIIGRKSTRRRRRSTRRPCTSRRCAAGANA